jgi:molecular chaperone DnaK (HSP70)
VAADAKDAVVAVPLGCSAEHKAALAECAKQSGFNVKQFISEPVAAALAYGVGHGARGDETVVVMDLGASKATATVVRSRGGALSVVGSTSDAAVGGAAHDAAIMQSLIKEFKKVTKMDISDSPKALAKLASAAVDTKHILSTNPNATLFVESLHDGNDFSHKLTRGKLDAALSSTYRKSVALMTKALESCGVTPEEVDQVRVCVCARAGG